MYEELVAKLRDHNACISIKTLDDAADAIEELQKRVPKTPHGRWTHNVMVHESGIKANGISCSICGATYNISITLPDMDDTALNFCPNCGADMRGSEGE